jgi:aspartate/methionine/tyrosine aminotransferase
LFTSKLAKKGVIVLPASVFHHEGHFRISLTIGGEILEKGIQILAAFLPEYQEQIS